LLFSCTAVVTDGFSAQQQESLSRRDVLKFSTAALVASASGVAPNRADAFDGQGSSSYSGRTPATLASKAKAYRDRIAADVKDFNSLGAAIDRGETSGDAWVAFFIQYQRREPDSVGRTYAAQVDLTGLENSGGGAGLLLAATYAKPNKPPDNLLQFKKYNALAKTLETVKNAGKSDDSTKAKKEWTNASVSMSEYLETVAMPSDLSDPIYK
jgi:hypothetical protein